MPSELRPPAPAPHRPSAQEFAALAQRAMAQQASANGLPTRRLGKTDEQVSILCLGGAHLGRVGLKDEPEALRIFHAAVDNGVRFIDNAWAYNDGYSEQLVGKAMTPGVREKLFLMTKNTGRDFARSKSCLEDSLTRLKTDHLDLWQFHETNYDNDPDWIFERGAIDYALEAQRAGKVRYIGFTGHKDPRILNKMLAKGFAWDTAQMPINVMDYFYRSFFHETLPLCLSADIGVLGMKNLGGGVSSAKIPDDTSISADQCVRYALSQPITTAVRGWTTMQQLESDLAVARDFVPMSSEELQSLLAVAEADAGDGRHEQFKSTRRFDNPIYREMHGLPVQGDQL
ncbi:MAG: aldo/keto reductase [Acidobacteria bacterium]|nr:aldo/keto reductase [Acidobacteriota bacterium]MDA1235364.1 aldo/keto reductase [Acidobacteriota bacterium]